MLNFLALCLFISFISSGARYPDSSLEDIPDRSLQVCIEINSIAMSNYSISGLGMPVPCFVLSPCDVSMYLPGSIVEAGSLIRLKSALKRFLNIH